MAKKKLICGIDSSSSGRMRTDRPDGMRKQRQRQVRRRLKLSHTKRAVDTFNEIAEKFNETHDDIHLTIHSPNEAMTILKHASSVKIIRISLQ